MPVWNDTVANLTLMALGEKVTLHLIHPIDLLRNVALTTLFTLATLVTLVILTSHFLNLLSVAIRYKARSLWDHGT